MIKDKKTKATEEPQIPDNTGSSSEPIEVAGNPFEEIYLAVKRALLTIKHPKTGETFFRTIKIDNGQFSRLIRSDNTEFETAFPAVFIHYTNIRWLVLTSRLGEARATMRISIVLNTLNNSDDGVETMPFWVWQWVNQAINKAKNTEQALSERCQLQYADMPTTTNMLQAYWIDYEVWFRDTSSWEYQDWIEKYVVIPPYTNYSDAPDIHQKPDADSPTYDDTSSIILAGVDTPEEPPEDNGSEN